MPPVPKLAANLSMMFQEVGFLDRFAAAAAAGFRGVEFLFPYEFPAAEIAARLKQHGLAQALFNLPPGDFATPIFDVVLKRLTIRGSIVGTRKDLAEAVAFASAGKVRPTIERRRLEDVNEVLQGLREGHIQGRVVLDIGSA